MDRTGTFIVLEGIDGTGKSIQCSMLEEYFKHDGKDVVKSFEPTKSSPHGIKLREGMMNRDIPFTFDEELFLFMEDRKWHVDNVIKPGLQSGKVVILDRYYYSTVAYQGTRGVMGYEEILKMNEKFAPKPDYIFILVLDVEKALKRIDKDDSRGRSYFEKHDRLSAIQSVFLNIHDGNKYNTFKIDASRNPEEVHASILEYL